MKLVRIVLLMLGVLVLAACNGDSGDSTMDNGNVEQPNNNGNDAGGSTEDEGTDTGADVDGTDGAEETGKLTEQIVVAAKDLAGSSTAHEGKMEVYERIMEGESPLEEQTIESLYAQNESTGDDETGHQLYNEKITTGSESIETQFYRQPEMASYSYYGPDDSWHATDYSQLDESIEQRLDYMSPYDALQLYEEYKDGAEVMAFDDGTITVSFSIDPEKAIAEGLEYHNLEPESFYYTSDYMFELNEYAMMLTFDERNEMLIGVHVESRYRDKANDWVELIIQGRQTYESYMLTDEIRPPADAFTSTGLDKWDY